MLRTAVLVSGGGTNLQAVIDRVKDGTVTNVSLELVISNKKDAYALTRARDNAIPGVCISPKEYDTREAFEDALLAALLEKKCPLSPGTVLICSGGNIDKAVLDLCMQA